MGFCQSRLEVQALMGLINHLGVQIPWTEYTFISIPDAALDYKDYIGGNSPACVLVEVQSARKLVVIHTFIVAD